MNLYAKTSRASDERKRHSFEHRRTLYRFAVLSACFERPRKSTNNQNRIGLVNRKIFSIHHVANSARFS